MRIILGLALLVSVVACGHGPRHHMDHMWQEMDANNDGAISREEFAKANDMKFTEADTNKDGKVTTEERDAFFKSQFKKHRGDCKECDGKKGECKDGECKGKHHECKEGDKCMKDGKCDGSCELDGKKAGKGKMEKKPKK